MGVAHFYHCYAAGHWREAAGEHVTALHDSGFTANQITVGLVGNAEEVNYAKDWFTLQMAGIGPLEFVTADAGYEHVTLSALRDWAIGRDTDAAVMYAHTKGAAYPNGGSAAWRHTMTAAVVADWRACAALLGEFDAVGPSWMISPWYSRWFFAGNFWWARASYLARLPVLPAVDAANCEGTAAVFGQGGRYDAEVWIGLGDPRICDLRPGLPLYGGGS